MRVFMAIPSDFLLVLLPIISYITTTSAINHTRIGYYVVGCYRDKLSGADFIDGPHKFDTISHDACARLCISKNYRYAGLQLREETDDRLVARRVVLCSCGNAFGQYGASRACTVPCPKPPLQQSDTAPRTNAIGSEMQPGQNSELCGNVLANTVIYVFTGACDRIVSVTEKLQQNTIRSPHWAPLNLDRLYLNCTSSFPSAEIPANVISVMMLAVAAVEVIGGVWLAWRTHHYAKSMWEHWGKSISQVQKEIHQEQ